MGIPSTSSYRRPDKCSIARSAWSSDKQVVMATKPHAECRQPCIMLLSYILPLNSLHSVCLASSLLMTGFFVWGHDVDFNQTKDCYTACTSTCNCGNFNFHISEILSRWVQHWALWVLGWMTFCTWVIHLGMQSTTHINSAWPSFCG